MVHLGDNKELQVVGVGTVVFHTNSGKTQKLEQVQYVPCLAHNLLSDGQLLKSGFNFTFADDECIITDKELNTLLVHVRMSSHMLFPLAVNEVGEAQVVHGRDKQSKECLVLNSQSLHLL